MLADDSFSNGSRLQIDGTACLVHTLPEETYNSPAAPRALKKVEQNYREAGVSDHVLMLFGIGDGGGKTNLRTFLPSGVCNSSRTLLATPGSLGCILPRAPAAIVRAGGPGVEHLERLQRVQNLAGLCPVTQETAQDFFAKWREQSADFPT